MVEVSLSEADAADAAVSVAVGQSSHFSQKVSPATVGSTCAPHCVRPRPQISARISSASSAGLVSSSRLNKSISSMCAP